MANVPIRRAVNSLVIVPAVFKSHAHCVAVQVFVVSDVFAHGDSLLWFACFGELILTQVGEGARAPQKNSIA